VPTTHILKPAIAGFELLRREIGPASVAELEVSRFVDAPALNWLIAGTDAHAKNYSLLLVPGQVRLAPLYDVASSLPYDEMYRPRLRLAMRIGSEYRVDAITGRHWAAFARLNGLDGAAVRRRVGGPAARGVPGGGDGRRGKGVAVGAAWALG
jgi:serine/threonine-protein kinase HipA